MTYYIFAQLDTKLAASVGRSDSWLEIRIRELSTNL